MRETPADPVSTAILAARLREARTTLGLTQHDVSQALGIGRTSVTDIEGGRRAVSGLELRRLARLYRRPAGWLLGDEPDPPIDPGIIEATASLSGHDRDLVIQFAQFLAQRNGGQS